jgi:hypothetical protein
MLCASTDVEDRVILPFLPGCPRDGSGGSRPAKADLQASGAGDDYVNGRYYLVEGVIVATLPPLALMLWGKP